MRVPRIFNVPQSHKVLERSVSGDSAYVSNARVSYRTRFSVIYQIISQIARRTLVFFRSYESYIISERDKTRQTMFIITKIRRSDSCIQESKRVLSFYLIPEIKHYYDRKREKEATDEFWRPKKQMVRIDSTSLRSRNVNSRSIKD